MTDKTAIHTVYKLANGQRVPSVTTYLGILAKPAVIHWAWECGVQGLDYRKVRDQAGGTGVLVHYLILCELEKKEPDLSAYSEQDIAASATSMGKFKEWLHGNMLEPILLETPLVSEALKFGGTPDCYGVLNGVKTLVDFKTSKEIYQENFYQLAAYKVLLEEHGYPVEAAMVLRVGKSEDEGFEIRTMQNLDKHFEIFLSCRNIYEWQKEVRKDK